MEVFNNNETSGYEEIVSYGPKWWTEYTEMDANYRFAGWTLDLMAEFLDKIVQNIFPDLADVHTVIQYEKLLNIIPEDDDTLADRRRTIAAYFNGNGKLSRTAIKAIIKAYNQCESDVYWEDLVLQIRIHADKDYRLSNMRIKDIISRRMPAHIPFMLRYVLCEFVIVETIAEKIKYRFPIGLYDTSLDGRYLLNGELDLSSARGPYFKFKTIVRVDNSEEVVISKERHRAEFKDFTEEIGSKIKHRFQFIWWPGNLLDGNSILDGTLSMDQDTSPIFNRAKYRTCLETKEDITMSVYYPSKDVFVDGTYSLDGSINLNSGREEL